MTKILLFIFLIFAGLAGSGETALWLTGDFHHHTWLTDGRHTQEEVAARAFNHYFLDWLVNSEHGGRFGRDPQGRALPAPLWRWLTLRDLSFPIIQDLRRRYPDKFLLQGLEWNIPAHDHAGVGIIKDEPAAISDFEYMFDRKDLDHSREGEGLRKRHTRHEDALAAVRWLREKYAGESYLIINHPSRKMKYSAADLRDFHQAAMPDLCFGLEGIPGHQKAPQRGGYNQDLGGASGLARTYGGADYMVAKVGGMWDALLGEGRRIWIFANSDFHHTDNDFWPGEYAKTYTRVPNRSYSGLVQAWRAGCSFVVTGNLITALDFRAEAQNRQAVMGETLRVRRGEGVRVLIRFQSRNAHSPHPPAKVDHVDLIAGEMKNPALPGTPGYKQEDNPTTRLLARFLKNDWRSEAGWELMEYRLSKVERDMYLRLRGTNLGLGVADETDEEGNPLCDDLMGPNNAAKAWRDLWFYSNPIFIQVER